MNRWHVWLVAAALAAIVACGSRTAAPPPGSAQPDRFLFDRANQALMQVERRLTRPEGLRSRSWYKSLQFAADLDRGYQTMAFPSVNEAIRYADADTAVRELDDLVRRIESSANARGCVTATTRACAGGQTCDEVNDRCATACDVTADGDGDGHVTVQCGGDDCDDADPSVHPGAPEYCYDGIDQDCDGKDTACERDNDCDGYIDCEDSDCRRPGSCGCDGSEAACTDGGNVW